MEKFIAIVRDVATDLSNRNEIRRAIDRAQHDAQYVARRKLTQEDFERMEDTTYIDDLIAKLFEAADNAESAA